MVGSGRVIALALFIVAAVIVVISGLWVFGSLNQANSTLQSGGAALTMGCAILIAAIIAGVGIWFMMQGRSEALQFAGVEQEKLILNMVQTQGTVQISSVALETNMPLDKVKAAIYDLVGKGLFSGYIDWRQGRLVSEDAAAITQSVIVNGKCPNCGAPLEVGGKGVITCPYCGAEIFIPKAQVGRE
ncbi:MAG: hypothetical protein IVW55_13735 [Chloroflexi bacterium]|nr:hypothetical protein [Chloroflexota bacterium]